MQIRAYQPQDQSDVIAFHTIIGYSDDPVCVLSRRLENDG